MSLFTFWNAFIYFLGVIFLSGTFGPIPKFPKVSGFKHLEVNEWILSCNWLRSAQLANVAVIWKHVHNKATTSRERERARERGNGGQNSTLMELPSAPEVTLSHLEEPCITIEHRWTYTYFKFPHTTMNFKAFRQKRGVLLCSNDKPSSPRTRDTTAGFTQEQTLQRSNFLIFFTHTLSLTYWSKQIHWEIL